MEIFFEPIGQQIRRLRTEAGLTMEQLAKASGVGNRQEIYTYEHGIVTPPTKTLLRIAKALGCFYEQRLTPKEVVLDEEVSE